MVRVLWLSFHPHIQALGPWDTGMLDHLFGNKLWDTGHSYAYQETDHVPEGVERAIVVLPARHHASEHDIERLNAELAKLAGVLLILVGDEEHIFPWKQVRHDNLALWVMLPDVKVHGDMPWAYFFGDGWKADTPSLMPAEPPTKGTLWSFAGQITNERRKRAANGLRRARARVPGRLTQTTGFTQGMPREEYLAELVDSWVVPCPGGPATQDTFRFFETLEAGAIPIIEVDPYWHHAFGSVPATFVSDWDGVGGTIEGLLSDRVWWSNQWQCWYGAYKRGMARRLNADLTRIGIPATASPETTILVSTSPSILHPSTDQIMSVIYSALEVVGEGTPVLVMADGIRAEQRHLRDGYLEYLRRLHWILQKQVGNAYVIQSDTHVHQARLTRSVLNLEVTTPNVLFMEHDTPLVVDEPIPWAECEALVSQGAVDVLRFHHEAAVHPEHEHLMVDHDTIEMMSVPLRRTHQWSQRPHLASADYYRHILRREFSVDATCFIEDRMHSVAQAHPRQHRLAIFHPDSGNIKRSYHLDGRQGEPKFDESQVF